MSDEWVKELNWALFNGYRIPDGTWKRAATELQECESLRDQPVWGLFANPQYVSLSHGSVPGRMMVREYTIIANAQFFHPKIVAAYGLTYDEALAFKKLMDSTIQGG